MTFTQLRVFIAIAEHGSFTAAGDALQMSQPAVSRAVRALERELGALLLLRERDGVRLTRAGNLALAHACEVLRHARLLRDEVSASGGDVRGQLVIASFPTATAQLLPPLLTRYRDRYPQVRVRLLEGTDQEGRQWLEQRAADIAVVVLPAEGLRTVGLGEDEMAAVVPTGHQLAQRRSVSLADLKSEPFILSTGGCEPLIAAAARRTSAEFQASFEVREAATILAMVEAGLGVSVVPTLALCGQRFDLAVVRLRPKLPRHLALAVPAQAEELAPAARAFLALAGDPGTETEDAA